MIRPNDPKGDAGSKKCPLDLLPPVALAETAWVLGLGARKYGRKVPVFACSKGEELEEFCSCGHSTLNQFATPNAHTQLEDSVSSVTIKNTQKAKKPNATQGESFGLKDSVNPVTINTLEKLIQNIGNTKKQQQMLGFPQTKSMSENKPLNEIDDQRCGIGITYVTEKELCSLLDLVSEMRSEYLKNKIMGAQFAVGQQGGVAYSTSTTTTPPESLGGLFATDATKDLACLETISKLLKKHSPTCAVQNLIVRDGEIEQCGAYNWRRTKVCVSTYVAAAKRHLDAYWSGEELDPESGRSHLAHVAACMMIVMDATKNGCLVQDFPVSAKSSCTDSSYGPNDFDSHDERTYL